MLESIKRAYRKATTSNRDDAIEGAGAAFGPDDAITMRAHDTLSRAPFAQALANLIHAAPQDSSFRIGVYGDWGEGKTSVMRLVAESLQGKGHACITFTPVGAHSSRDMQRRIAFALAKGVGIDTPEWFRKALEGTERIRADAQANLALRSVDHVFGDYIDMKLEAWWSKDVMPQLHAKLKKTKVVVLIDDLDRVRPEHVPDLLLMLRDALHLPGVYYVLGLAPAVLSESLRTVQPAWGDSQRFLEKIVEYPFQVPTPSDGAIAAFVHAELSVLEPTAAPEAVAALIPLLSKNPRRIKLFLRRIAYLRTVTARFSDTELPRRVLYALELLKAEFPSLALKMSENPALLTKLRSVRQRRIAGIPTDETIQSLIAEMAPDEQARAARSKLDSLFEELTEADNGDYTIEEIFHLGDRPPVLSKLEFTSIMESATASLENGVSLLRGIASVDGQLVAHRVEAVFRRALEDREFLVELASAEYSAERAKRIAHDAIPARTAIIKTVLVDWNAMQQGFLSLQTWQLLVDHVIRWSRWTSEEHWVALRGEELNLLGLASAGIPESLGSEVLKRLRGVARQPWSPDTRPSDEVLAVLSDLESRLANQLVDRLLGNFVAPDGLRGLNEHELNFMMDPREVFHAAPHRERLVNLASTARSNADVHHNIVRFLRLIQSGASGGALFLNSENAKLLIQDRELMILLWEAAMARPLSQRILGSLSDLRALLRRDYDYEEAKFPLPPYFRGESGGTLTSRRSSSNETCE